jgi:hypothetical protein
MAAPERRKSSEVGEPREKMGRESRAGLGFVVPGSRIADADQQAGRRRGARQHGGGRVRGGKPGGPCGEQVLLGGDLAGVAGGQGAHT